MSDAPADVTALLRTAVTRHQAGALGEAEADYRHVLTLVPEHPDALHLLGLCMHQTGRNEEAATLIRRAVQQRPGNATYLFNCGVVLSALGRYDEAADDYRQAATLRPDQPSYQNNLGLALGAAGRLDEAEAAFAAALRLQPGFPEAAVNLADLLSRRGLRDRLAEAEALVRGVIAGQPELAKAHAVLARAIPPGERRAEAIAAARRATVLAPEEPLHWLLLADLCRAAGQPDEAETAAREASERGPGNADAWSLLGVSLLAQDRADEALAALDRALALDPHGRSEHDALTAASRYVALLKLARHDEAAALVDLDRLVVPAPIEAPAGFADVAAFNDAVEAEVLAHPSLRWEPTGYVVRSGSLTDNLLPPTAPVFADMEQAIRNGIARYVSAQQPDPQHPFRRALDRRYRMVMWAVVLDEGGEVRTHIHEGSWISGAYYVRIPAFARGGGHEHDGAIEFGRPDDAVADPPLRVVEPAEGLLVLFPGSMYHRTVPFKADGQRITISFNCYPYSAG